VNTDLLLFLLMGLLAGAGAAWLALRTSRVSPATVSAAEARAAAAEARAGAFEQELRQAEASTDALRARLEDEQRHRTVAETEAEQARVMARRQLEDLVTARQQLENAFKSLAADALDSSTRNLLQLAEERFRTLQEQASGDMRASKDAIGALVQPLSEKLSEYQERVQRFAEHGQRDLGQVGRQLHEVIGATQQLQQETARLVTALRAPHVRGRWGEVALRRVVELAGMSAHCDFDEQATYAGDEGRLRPDVVVKLPGGRTVIVDAKVALTAYLDAVEASGEDDRRSHTRRHAAQMRVHVDKLADKDYGRQLRATAEFVVLFIPGDAFLSAAAEVDPALIEYALERNVVIATPATLIALLRAVAYGWRQEQVAENAQQISDLGRQVHDRLTTLISRLATMGVQLNKTVKAYNEAVASLEARVLPAVRRFDELGVPSRKERLDPQRVETQARQPVPLELELE
jgi:DNA recombination protein RmuC